MSDPRSSVLITVDELAEQMSRQSRPIVLDVSDNLETAPLERPVIPGAIAVSLASDVSGPPTKRGGKRPLPDPDALQENLRRWGIDADSIVVVYDNTSGAQAGRAWWTLRWAGHRGVRVLDGGLAAWQAAGQATADQPVHPPGGGSFSVEPGNMPTIEAGEAAEIARQGVLLDARGKASYEGEPDNPATGHIPGATLAPSKNALGPSGHFDSTEELKALYRELGVDGSRPVGVYCGSGNAAAHELVSMYAAGIEAPLYVGSFSAWSGDPKRPVAKGSEPG
jgi:thiosulfate/3-mercaptopyruvate sulfurtransferase